MTIEMARLPIFVFVERENQLNQLHTVAFTHRNLPVSEIGSLHIDPDHQAGTSHCAQVCNESYRITLSFDV